MSSYLEVKQLPTQLTPLRLMVFCSSHNKLEPLQYNNQ
jgi:hypothetical protein